jgi:hypothetical protein
VLKIGQLVMLVGSDGYMPPFGAIGEIVAFDGEEYEVLFPRHPCPVPPGVTWFAEPSWLMPIDDGQIVRGASAANPERL